MNCSKVWDRNFLSTILTKKFIFGELKCHRENILFEREKCRLPEAMEKVARIKEAEKIQVEIDTLRHAITELETKKYDLYRKKKEKKQLEFTRVCPSESCNGFMNKKWECGVCDKNFCSKCNNEKVEGHTCDPNDVETMNLLRKDSKPCPSCGTVIFKISGCHQMWCIECHTAFDWVTGRIASGVIHNPHFYEFQRQNPDSLGMRQAGRNFGDIPCGGFPTSQELINYLQDKFGRNSPKSIRMMNLHRSISHIDRVVLNELTRDDDRDDNYSSRISFLMGHITEADFKNSIQRNDKRRSKNENVRHLMEMIRDSIGDCFRQYVLGVISYDVVIGNSDKIREYAQNEFNTINKIYNSQMFWLAPRHLLVY